MPGRGRVFQLSSQPVIDHRTVLLTPTPDRRVVDHEPAFGHHFLDVPQLNEKRKYQRTQVAMISGSKWRPRKMAGRFLFIALP